MQKWALPNEEPEYVSSLLHRTLCVVMQPREAGVDAYHKRLIASVGKPRSSCARSHSAPYHRSTTISSSGCWHRMRSAWGGGAWLVSDRMDARRRVRSSWLMRDIKPLRHAVSCLVPWRWYRSKSPLWWLLGNKLVVGGGGGRSTGQRILVVGTDGHDLSLYYYGD